MQLSSTPGHTGYLATILQHNAVQRAYYARRAPATMVPTATPYVRRQVDELVRFAQLIPGERVLEVGSGMGRHAMLLARRGITVDGLELSPDLIRRFRQLPDRPVNLRVIEGDIHMPPPELEGPYDAVVGFFVLHHLADLAVAFRQMVRLLRPGGRIAFLEPNAFNPLFYLQILLTPGMTWAAERGLPDMRPAKLSHLMAEVGLTPLPVRRYGFFPPFLANRVWGARLDCLFERCPVVESLLPFQLVGGRL